MYANRVFIIVLDSYGIGAMPDAEKYGDKGANTLRSIALNKNYSTPNLWKMGLFNIDGVDCKEGVKAPLASYARMTERSEGKDTTVGHWEIAGAVSEKALPVFEENGMPQEFIEKFENAIGRKVLCNKAYSGTQVIVDYGEEHEKTGYPIVYTSADSVFQIAAHESVIPPNELYEICSAARELLRGEWEVGRVIARPFEGEYPNYRRTANRHDYALPPPKKTMLDCISESGLECISVGKISDIFTGRGVTDAVKTKNNVDGMEKSIKLLDRDFKGLCFVNLVDFDMVYGHRNNVDGYANAASVFDRQLSVFLNKMRDDDILIITADHGCDPGDISISHSREYTPMLIYSKSLKGGVNLGTRSSFADIGATVLEILGVKQEIEGESFWREVNIKK